MAARLVKTRSLFSPFYCKNVLKKPRNVLGFQKVFLSNQEREHKPEEFRLDYLDGPQEGDLYYQSLTSSHQKPESSTLSIMLN